MFFNKKKKLLNSLINRFSSLITDDDETNCKELLANNEYLLCYNTLVTQVYEYDVEITMEDYEFFKDVAQKIKISPKEYELLKELIRDEGNIPKTVKENISDIIENIKEDKTK